MSILPLLKTSFSTILMSIEMLVAEFLFCSLLKKRKFFFWRQIIATLVICEIVILTELLYYKITDQFLSYGSVETTSQSAFKFIFYLVLFVITVVIMCLCYDNSKWMVIFFCSGGYAAQHIAVNISLFIAEMCKVSSFWLRTLIDVACCLVVYVVTYFMFINKKEVPASKSNIKAKVLLSLAVIFICIGVSRITTDDITRGKTALIAETINAIVSCTLVLVILFNLTEKDRFEHDKQVMEELLRREKEHYILSKENIDIINLKCHDLKHQINALRGAVEEQQLNEIESAVMIYQSITKTGNDVLDVILTEKSLYCEKNGIRLTCLANGKDLDFMAEQDIYSLFGNALTNAIECVSKIHENDRRCISVNIMTVGGMLSIHIENFVDEKIRFENGLPVTDKDSNYHGFGMKSMSYITARYGGEMEVSVKDGIFLLDIIFPLGGEK